MPRRSSQPGLPAGVRLENRTKLDVLVLSKSIETTTPAQILKNYVDEASEMRNKMQNYCCPPPAGRLRYSEIDLETWGLELNLLGHKPGEPPAC